MKLIVPADTEKTRLGVYVTQLVAQTSRSFIQKLCDQGKVLVNGVSEPERYKVRPGDVIVIEYDFDQSNQIPTINLPVLYEDDSCIVIDKPYGILTHSKGAFNPEATVATFIADKLTGFDASDSRAGIVHRLDRATSGVILCAKTPEVLTWFQKQFSKRNVKKTYYAVISGHIDPSEAVIDIPIGRNPRNPKAFYATIHGKPARTQYRTVETGEHYTLLELKPETGRTHQLRVHLQHLKHPIVGDDFYGGEPAERLYLHARELEITLMNSERATFTSELPESFNEKVRS